MHEGIGSRFPESSSREIRNDAPDEPDHYFLLVTPGLKPAEQLLHQSQQRPTEEVVHFHTRSRKHLKRRLVRWNKASQRRLLSEKQEPKQSNVVHFAVGVNRPQRLGNLDVGKVLEARIALLSRLPHASAEPLELERIKI